MKSMWWTPMGLTGYDSHTMPPMTLTLHGRPTEEESRLVPVEVAVTKST